MPQCAATGGPQLATPAKLRLEVEYCPPQLPFGHRSCGLDVGPWMVTPPGVSAVNFVQTISGLSSNTPYRWRARVQYGRSPLLAATEPANPPHGPWRRVGAQSVEADIAVPEPGLSLGLAAGSALIALLGRRRRHRARRSAGVPPE